MSAKARDAGPRNRPGLPELFTALTVWLVCLVLIVLWVVSIPDARAGFRGIVGNAANGVAGFIAFIAAWALRIRDFRAFGLIPADAKWLKLAFALGVLAFGLSFVIEHVWFSFITEANTQGDMQAAAKAGALSLIALLATGALLTPIGEELVFRGVIANALGRYGSWSGVGLSSLIFGAVHGPSVIFILAFMVGAMAAELLRRSGSLWPCILLHVTYNGLHLVFYALG